MLISIGMKISATKMTCAKTLRERIASWLESDAANLDISIDMQDLTDWIGEVIEENNLGALVLFWDEFSKFFSNNRNNLDEFQRLAELSNLSFLNFDFQINYNQTDERTVGFGCGHSFKI